MEDILFHSILRRWQKHSSYGKPPLVVYDVDDILWSLMDRVTEHLGIDYNRATYLFSVRDNPKLTPEEKRAIIDDFANPKMFENIQFYPGAEDILKVEQMGAHVRINSNAFNAEIGRLKTEQLLAHIPDLTPEHIQMNIINPKDTHKKEMNPDTVIFIDDSEHNILLSPAVINVMPTDRPMWCTNSEAIHRLCAAHKSIAWRADLRDINRFVEMSVGYLQKHSSH